MIDRERSGTEIFVRPSAVTAVLAAVTAVVAVLGVGGQVMKYRTGHTNIFGIVPQFFLDSEQNVATYFASLLLLLAAALLAVIAWHAHQAGKRFRRHWTGLSAVFLFMSLDEAVSFHELLIEPLRETLGAGGILHFTWVVAGAAFVLVMGLLYSVFLYRLPPPFRRLFVVSGALYVAAVLGIESLGAARAEAAGHENLPYVLIASVEEIVEMAAIVLFIYALLRYVARYVGIVRFHAVDA